MSIFMRVCAAMLVLAGVAESAGASDGDIRSNRSSLRADEARLLVGKPQLAPMAHTKFCVEFPKECVTHGAGNGSARSLADVARVNARVNEAIAYQHNDGGLRTENWSLFPEAGDCNDYAVSKRHLLIAQGWRPSELLLAEVIVSTGKHHLVLVVRHASGDLVLDSIDPRIKTVADVPYRFVRAQSPANPMFWVSVTRPAGVVTIAQRKGKKTAARHRGMSRVAANVYSDAE